MKQPAEMTDEELIAEDRELERRWRNARSGEGHGGSPGEWILERSDEITAELNRRMAP